MTDTFPIIYGIGNPLIDVVISAMDDDLKALKLNKGIMDLVDLDRQEDIIQYFKDKEPRYFPGGSAPNTMLACAGLGTPSLIAGKIGKDEFGEIYIDQVKKYGAVSGLVQGEGPTGSSIILVTPDGERTMNTHLGMCREFSADDIDTEKLSQSTFFYFTGYMWDTESQKAAIQKAITIAHENNVQIAFDVADMGLGGIKCVFLFSNTHDPFFPNLIPPRSTMFINCFMDASISSVSNKMASSD